MARTAQNSSHKPLEQYLEAVESQGGIYSNYPMVINNSITANSVTSSGALSVGTLNYTAAVGSAIAASTAAPTTAQSGTIFTLARAAGSTITLPTASTANVGLTYTFVVTTAVTSSAYKIYTGSSSIFYVGTDVVGLGTENDVAIFQGDGATNTYFNMNGTTTGGLVGSTIEVVCLSATVWQLNAVNFASGSIATSFATS